VNDPPQRADPESTGPQRTGAALSPIVVLLALAAGFTLVMMHGAIARAAQEMHPFEVAFFRNFFGFMALLPMLIREEFRPLRTRHIGLHALRGALSAASMLLFFYALPITPLALITALGFTAPLFATLGAVLVLGERIRLRRTLALVVGFAGMLIVVRPGITEVGIGPICALVSSFLWAIALVDVKVLTRTESSLAISAYMLLFLTPITFGLALFFWSWPSLELLFWLVLIGVLGSTGHMCLTEAMRRADATLVMPFEFMRLIWASLLGFIAFGQVPDVWTWVGGSVIFASTLYIAWREHQTRRSGGS
jgi:drug/metabolite transporter (DMT)-like permease